MHGLLLVGQHLPAVDGALDFLVRGARRANVGSDDENERGRQCFGIVLQC